MFTSKSKNALRALTSLAENYGQGLMSTNSLARLDNLKQPFLENILNELRRGDLVTSGRGKAGGYELTRPPEQITLADILRVTEVWISPPLCVSGEKPCTDCPEAGEASAAACGLRGLFERLRRAILDVLAQVTLADLVADKKMLGRKRA